MGVESWLGVHDALGACGLRSETKRSSLTAIDDLTRELESNLLRIGVACDLDNESAKEGSCRIVQGGDAHTVRSKAGRLSNEKFLPSAKFESRPS